MLILIGSGVDPLIQTIPILGGVLSKVERLLPEDLTIITAISRGEPVTLATLSIKYRFFDVWNIALQEPTILIPLTPKIALLYLNITSSNRILEALKHVCGELILYFKVKYFFKIVPRRPLVNEELKQLQFAFEQLVNYMISDVIATMIFEDYKPKHENLPGEVYNYIEGRLKGRNIEDLTFEHLKNIITPLIEEHYTKLVKSKRYSVKLTFKVDRHERLGIKLHVAEASYQPEECYYYA